MQTTKQQIMKISFAFPRHQTYEIKSRTHVDNIMKISPSMVLQIDCKDIPSFFEGYETISGANPRNFGHNKQT